MNVSFAFTCCFILCGLLIAQAQTGPAQTASVVINEIMYHPSSHNPREEYIELYNRSATNVNLSGWKLDKGINFTCPTNTVIGASNYLVVAGNLQAFTNKYPGVTNVVGGYVVVRATNVVGFTYTNFENTLSNTRDEVRLVNVAGTTIDFVTYADRGEWAVRQRGVLNGGYQGWTWFNPANGFGKSMELRNPALPRIYGHNWSPSVAANGTPGTMNSAFSTNIPPIIADVAHTPMIPQPSNTVAISARVVDESAGLTVRAFWRVNNGSPGAFTPVPMLDNGASGDGAAGDGIYGVVLPAQPDMTIVEFYVEAVDVSNRTNTWPRDAVDTDGVTLMNRASFSVNALYQVDTTVYSGTGHLYRVVMTPAEQTEFGNLLSGNPNSDAMFNCTFISVDGQGTQVRYQCGVRTRGNGSRSGSTTDPLRAHNYRVGFPTDTPWKNVNAININARYTWAQVFGAMLGLRSGVVGNDARLVQWRMNGGLGPGGTPSYGVYAATESEGSDYASNHFPNDDGGNAYSVDRVLGGTTSFTWRGSNAVAYTNYAKDSNRGEADWTDMVVLHRIIGTNDLFTAARARQVIDVEQWLAHLGFMALLDNRETGLNSGINDDYSMYRGVNDPRFLLLYHDLDTINGQGDTAGSTTSSIFGATVSSGQSESGPAMNQLMRAPEFEPLYYQTLQRLLNRSFAKTNYDALIRQTLGAHIPSSVISTMITWMDNRRNYVQGVLNNYFATNPPPPTAAITGEPRSPTPFTAATLTVGGSNVVNYKFRLNAGAWSAETPVATAISLSGLANSSSNVVFVIGKSSVGAWQDTNNATMSKPWIVNTTTPAVRLNEILAWNTNALQHGAVFPDVIEFYNEGGAPVDLGGLRLTDNPANPSKFVFPSNTVVGAGAYLIAYGNNNDGSGGIHLGFGLNNEGDSLYLIERSPGTNVLDSVTFGLQLADKSIGRTGASGEWKLCQPSFGAANTNIALGNLYKVRINEWLASGVAPFVDDFVELFNPNAAPVDIGNCYFTDEPIGAPRMHKVPPLTFLAGGEFVRFFADGQSSPHHLNFALDADQDQVSLLDPALAEIDGVIFAMQQPGVSQGRCPDGANSFRSLATPTPGIGNACPATSPNNPNSVRLMEISQGYRWDQSDVDWGTAWIAPGFDDTSWASGSGFFGTQFQGGGNAWDSPVNTLLTTTSSRFTWYFRTRFTNNLGSAITDLQVNHLIDDGAVFYLNGQEWFRYNMPAGQPTIQTRAASNLNPTLFSGGFSVPMTALSNGVNFVAVELHQSPSSTADIGFGFTLDAIVQTNSASSSGVVINEVFAKNSSITEPDGSTPDWVELFNPGSSSVDLTGASLTDDVSNPLRWVFPNGALIPAGGFLRVFFADSQPASATNTGYGLKDTGDSVYLFGPGLTLLDSINFGLQAADFSIGRVPTGSTNWALSVPSAGASNMVATLGDVTQLKVNEWMANPSSGDDWFEIFNPNAQPVALANLWLTDNLSTPATRMAQQLPKLSFIGAGVNAYQEFIADGAPENGPNHVNFSLKAGGESAGISLADGTQIDGVTWNTSQAAGVSQGRFPDGATNIVSFTVSQSPGDMNWLPLTNIVISEVLSHTDLPLEDAIEIQNTNGAAVSINGWFISDSKQNLKKYPITNAIAVPPGGFVVFYETQFNNSALAPNNFALSSAHGETLYVSAATNGVLTGYRAQVSFDAAENGTSFGRYRKSTGEFDFTAISQRTFGADTPSTVAQFRTGAGKTNAYPKVGPVVFTEVMYHPPNIGTNDNTRDEFIEIRNVASTNMALYDSAFPTNRWRIRGGVDFDFPAVVLAPSATLVVVGFDPTADSVSAAEFRSAYSLGSNTLLFGPWRGKLSNGSDKLELQRPDAPQTTGGDAGFVPHIVVDHVKYSDAAPWPTNADGFGVSLHRVSTTGYGNDVTNWVAAAPTPLPPLAGNGDTDGDGMPDTWEAAHDLNPYDGSDAYADSDNDGMTNLQEYLAGTDPQDDLSVLKMFITVAPPNAAQLSFNAAANVSYTIQYRTNVTSGSWSNLQSVAAAPSNRVVTITNVVPPKFFRVVTP